MPTIYPPKLRDIYANTFFIPSSITTTLVTSNYVLASDGNGTTRWVAQSGGGGPATIPADLTVSTLYAFDTISTSSTFTGYISAGIGLFNYMSTQDLRVSSINGLPPGSGGITTIPPVLNLSTLYVANTISTSSTFTGFISSGIGLFNYISTQDLRVSSINGLPPGSGSNTPNLNLSTLYVADTISTSSTFTGFISAGIGVFNFISVADFYVSSINNQAVLTPVDLTSTVVGLGTAGYVSSLDLFSTTTGIGEQINSTVVGLGTAGYISSLSLNSTVVGLGTAGYVSSLDLFSTTTGIGQQINSTVIGLGTAGYISSLDLFSTTTGIEQQLNSTVVGLGTAGYISSLSLNSTVIGLGTAGYVSSLDLFSTTAGVGQQINSTVTGLGTAGYISSLSLNSTVIGLGTAGYVSSLSLNSTVLGLPSLRFGSGQTNDTGISSLTFTPAYTTTPAVYVTPQGFAVLAVTGITTTGATVLSFNPTNGLAQGAVPFQWQAIGFM
jgi:hypothetical protein